MRAKSNDKKLVAKDDSLRTRLAEAEEALYAIRSGAVDALVVSSAYGDQVFTLKGADQSYRLLVEDMSEGALILTAEGVIFYANHRLAEMLRTPLEHLAGSQMNGWVAPADQTIFEALLSHNDTQTRRYSEVALATQDGTLVPVKLSTNEMRPEGAQRYIGVIVSDLSAQRHAAELARSNAELAQFAYVVSHDLQEPLRMVTGYVQLLEKRLADKLDPDTREFMGYAVDGAQRMQNMIQDILTYSRVNARGERLAPVDSAEALKEALGMLASRIAETGADVDAHSLPIVMADRTQLVQLLQNLIGNAIKFCKDRAPRVRVQATHVADRWRFSVTDNGIGIAPEYRRQLFVIFKRLHTRREYPGTGIGLAICKRIVERHGGEIGIESAPNGGSVFWFTLPEEKSI